MKTHKWRTVNPSGSRRILVTKKLPGQRWMDILTAADCRIEISTSTSILRTGEIKAGLCADCDGVIGQLTEEWGNELFASLKAVGGRVYSNYAVGFNNVDLEAATKHGIAVGNTPGVLTETTAEMAVALTFAAARRVGEAERFLRAGKYVGWLPTLFLGELLWRKTLGIIGAGRIGEAYARMMVEGHKMNLVYFDIKQNHALEDHVKAYALFLQKQELPPVTCKKAVRIEEMLEEADVVSIHTVLNDSTHHLFDAPHLSLMKENAVLINTSRGPVIDETALINHCIHHPEFRAGLDVFEDEPELKPGLTELENVVIVPHIASATSWTRQGMATLAATNVAAILQGYPVWPMDDIIPFLEGETPPAAPSILNAKALNITKFKV